MVTHTVADFTNCFDSHSGALLDGLSIALYICWSANTRVVHVLRIANCLRMTKVRDGILMRTSRCTASKSKVKNTKVRHIGQPKIALFSASGVMAYVVFGII